MMTTLKPPAAGTSEEKLAAPDKAVFEGELQELMAPPGVLSPPPPLIGAEGATRTEADAQPIADDQTLDQPQDANPLTALNAMMLWQAIVPAVANVEVPVVPAAEAVSPEAVATVSQPKGELKVEGNSKADDEEVEVSELLENASSTDIQMTTEPVAANAAVAESTLSDLGDEAEELETPEDIKIEAVDVEASRSNDTLKPAHEQIHVKPHSLDRPVRALEAVRETQPPIQAEGSIRSAVVKMELVSETFGNLNISIKSIGQMLEADVQTSSQNLNQALHTNRPDLVQSVESKGLTLSQFDVRQQSQSHNPNQGQGQQQNEPPVTKEELERMARLNFNTAESRTTSKPLAGLVNTIA